MRQCVYCGESAGLLSRICGDCKKLLSAVEELRGQVGFGEFLDGLEQTGVAQDTSMALVTADPDGKGSVQDQVTPEMTTELMKVMGISGRQTVQEVKRIRSAVKKDSK